MLTRKFLNTSLLAALCLAPFVAFAATPADAPVLKERGETAEAHDARLAWFREARFGMFVHWGLYSAFGGERDGKPAGGEYGEWIMNHARIPLAEYSAKAKTFNPTHYDAEQWVLAAKGAGMKYIVITAKHHEGFAMFDSKVDDFNIVKATPFKRDPMRELVAACRKHGMKIGFYYSQNLDWSHAGGGLRGTKPWDPIHSGGDPDKYVDGLVIPQLRELLTNYGPIDILWFDIPGGVIDKPRADRVMAAVLACNPKILINNRLGGGYHGDTETPEQFVPATGFPGRDWETCMTMNNTWGFKKRDHNWKSTTSIIRMFSDIASKGGNFLLNVGPNELGEIPAPSLERMKAVGEWTAANAVAIYGTDASPFPRAFPWGRVTRRENTIYLHVFDLPKDRRLTLTGLTTPVKSAKMLVGGASLETGDKNGTPVVVLPEGVKLDPAVTVIAVELAGKPVVVAPVAPLQAPDAKGAYELKADDAVITGSLEVKNGAIGHWTKTADTVTWRCRVDRPGAYTVKIEYACEAASAGSEVRVAADGSLSADGKFIGGTLVVKSTGGFDKYAVSDAIPLDIAKSGPVVIELKAVKKPGHAVMNVRRVTIEPKQ